MADAATGARGGVPSTTTPATTPATTGATVARTREPRWVAVASLLLVGWFLARVRSGADLYDGSHVVALAQRLAQGDRLFADEENAQAVGSLFGVPFVWAWTHLVGQDYLVLATRWCYVLLAALVGVWCYRALRVGLRPAPAFVAVAGALVVTSYHVVGISYNTVPTLAMVVTMCQGYAALRGPVHQMARRLVPVGILLPLGAVSLQSLGPALVVTALLLLWLAWRRAGLRGLLPPLVAMAVTTVVVLGYAVAVLGLHSITDSLTYTVRYQAVRSSPMERLSFTTRSWLFELVRPVRLPVVLVGLAAAVPQVPARWRVRALVAFPLLLAASGLVAVAVHGINMMRYVGSVQLYTAMVMLPAVLLLARRDADVRLLLVLAAPTFVLGLPMIAATTFAGPWYGEFPPASVAMAIATTVGVCHLAQRLGGARALTRVGASGLLVLVGTQFVTNFYSNAPWQMLTPAPSGPYAGLLSGGRELWHLREVQQTTDRWVGHGESVLVYGAVTGAFLTAGIDSPANTNIVWLESFGEQGHYSVDWARRTGRQPDVVLLSTDMIDGDGLAAMMTRDPVLAQYREGYRVVAGMERFTPGQFRSEAGLVVLRRVGHLEP